MAPPPTLIAAALPLSVDQLLRSLAGLCRDIAVLFSASCNSSPVLKRLFSPSFRRGTLLAAVFDSLILSSAPPPRAYASSLSLFLNETLAAVSRLKSVLADCAARSRVRLVLSCSSVAADLRDLAAELAVLLDVLPSAWLTADSRELVALAAAQCRRSSPAPDPADEQLRFDLVAVIQEIERQIVPEKERLAAIFAKLGLADSGSCQDEIECLEREIGDRAEEKWTETMVAVVGLLRYGKFVLFGASTPRPSRTASTSSTVDSPSPPPDFRCPISLELMRDPVTVAASGQTYDRDSIARWFAAGHATCPKTGQNLSSLELIPNKALKNLIARWCLENDVGFEAPVSSAEPDAALVANKAALEAARMTASFLVEKLAASPAEDAANRVVHEIRQLAKSGYENRAFVAEAGALPLLVPLLRSKDAALQLNAVTAMLNLSILDANRRRIMHEAGAVDAMVHVMAAGATWRAKENAAATVLSLATVNTYRRRLGRNSSLVQRLVELARDGPASTKKDALSALLALAGERENMARLVECGVVGAALGSLTEEDSAVALIAAVAKRGGASAVAAAEGSVAQLVSAMKHGTEWARESAAAALVLLCRRMGAPAVAEVMAVPGIERAVWELMGTGGTERARRKAASLGRICRRWATAAAAGATADAAEPTAPARPGAALAVATPSTVVA